MALKVFRFLSLWLVALILAPSMAHLFEFPNKIHLDKADYLVVQQIYRGWALFSTLILPAIVCTLVLTIHLRGHRGAFLFSLSALLCLLAAQALFWTFTFPANQATNNWTMLPANWTTLRTQWEYSHAAGAVLNLAAFTLLLFSNMLSNTAPGHRQRAWPDSSSGVSPLASSPSADKVYGDEHIAFRTRGS